MTKRDQSAIVLTMVGVVAAVVGATILWGAGGGWLAFGLLALLVALVIGWG